MMGEGTWTPRTTIVGSSGSIGFSNLGELKAASTEVVGRVESYRSRSTNDPTTLISFSLGPVSGPQAPGLI